MRNDQILCQHKYGNKWKKDDYGIIGNWTGERKNHPWIPLVARTKPRYQLEFSWREPRKQRFLNLPPRKDKKHKLILPKFMIEEIPDDDEWKN